MAFGNDCTQTQWVGLKLFRIKIVDQLATFAIIGREGGWFWIAIGIRCPKLIRHQIGHWQANIDIKAIAAMLDMDDANIEIQIEVRKSSSCG